jgi:hypothetical protein
MTLYRKLVVIDYFGTILSLAGSTLIILPLIWVSLFYPTMPIIFRICLDREE